MQLTAWIVPGGLRIQSLLLLDVTLQASLVRDEGSWFPVLTISNQTCCMLYLELGFISWWLMAKCFIW